MKLNKNETLVLKLLIENASQTNVEISKKIGVTPQAVGKIRRRLESDQVITGYSAETNFAEIGIKTFAIALFSYTADTTHQEKDEDARQSLEKPNIITYSKIPEGDVTHIVMYGFRDLNELEEYFQKRQETRGQKSTLKRLYIFSGNGLIKNTAKKLLTQELGSRFSK
ncbi:MAG: Lrp/AsnC family transcriptional regulator [Candidatus Altiarchaeota archaeon]